MKVLIKLKPAPVLPLPSRTMLINRTLRKFYVLAVAPSTETQVKRNLKRVFTAAGYGHALKKIIIVRHQEYEVKNVVTRTVVKEPTEVPEELKPIITVVKKRGRKPVTVIKHTEEEEYLEYLRLKGKLPNQRHDAPKEKVITTTKRVRVKKKSYNGYLILELIYTKALETILPKVNGAIGLLPLRPTWYHKDPYTKKVRKRLPTERELDTKDDSGRTWQDDLDEWMPTALDTEEEARLLIGIQAIKTPTKPKLPLELKVGAMAEITHGAFTGQTGPIQRLDLTDEMDPRAVIMGKLLGSPSPVLLSLHQFKLVNKGE